jgi:hypothetical protein
MMKHIASFATVIAILAGLVFLAYIALENSNSGSTRRNGW